MKAIADSFIPRRKGDYAMKKIVIHKPGTVRLTGAATPKHADPTV
ncbi:hypothetical protein [Nonomuraea jabiensis]